MLACESDNSIAEPEERRGSVLGSGEQHTCAAFQMMGKVEVLIAPLSTALGVSSGEYAVRGNFSWVLLALWNFLLRC